MTEYCRVCGAPAAEVGPEAFLFNTCPLELGTVDEPEDVDPWEVANCLDEQLGEAEAQAWVEEMHRKVEAGEIPRTEPPPALVAAMEQLRRAYESREVPAERPRIHPPPRGLGTGRRTP